MTHVPTDARLDKLARHQFGLIGLSQGLVRDVTYEELLARVERGSLRRVHAGVYATMGSPSDWEQKVLAACLAAGPAALTSHRTAAAIWNLCDRTGPVDIVVPYAQCPVPGAGRRGRAPEHGLASG